MAVLVRGFKTWAERTAAGLRREMGLAAHAPLAPADLARFLDVQLWTPQDLPGLSTAARNQLLVHDPGGWSAVSCTVNGRDVVIYNPRHSIGRQASDIAHELAHIILNHEPGKMVMSQDGGMIMRSYDPKQEEEANWLGWCLLLPREALVRATKARYSVAQTAQAFGVSEQLVTYRLRMTGVNVQFKRLRGRRTG